MFDWFYEVRMNSSFFGDHIARPPSVFKTARGRTGVSVLQFAYFTRSVATTRMIAWLQMS